MPQLYVRCAWLIGIVVTLSLPHAAAATFTQAGADHSNCVVASCIGTEVAMEVIETNIFPGEDSAGDSDTAMDTEHYDPLQSLNKIFFQINLTVDKLLLRPIASAWKTIVPDMARSAIDNFFSNLKLPHIVGNQLLQGNFADAGHNTARFVFNSTIGLVGLFDAGKSMLNLPPGKEADFGQTLAFWGVPQGPYLMLPALGPYTVRNLPDIATSALTNPLNYEFVSTGWRVAATATDVINSRGYFIGPDEILYKSIDPYATTRDLHIQNRKKLISKVFDDGTEANQNDSQSDESFFESIEQGL